MLVIVSDDNQLLIADDFYRNEYALYEDTFSEVTIKTTPIRETLKCLRLFTFNITMKN